MEKKRCVSPYCVTLDGIKSRLFTPTGKPGELSNSWCPVCISTSNLTQYFSSKTAEMVRTLYRQYAQTNLPKNVQLILAQFAREIVGELGEEL